VLSDRFYLDYNKFTSALGWDNFIMIHLVNR